jgi:hypothetical protein
VKSEIGSTSLNDVSVPKHHTVEVYSRIVRYTLEQVRFAKAAKLESELLSMLLFLRVVKKTTSNAATENQTPAIYFSAL